MFLMIKTNTRTVLSPIIIWHAIFCDILSLWSAYNSCVLILKGLESPNTLNSASANIHGHVVFNLRRFMLQESPLFHVRLGKPQDQSRKFLGNICLVIPLPCNKTDWTQRASSSVKWNLRYSKKFRSARQAWLTTRERERWRHRLHGY